MNTVEEILGPSFYPHECGSMIECVTKQDALKAMETYKSQSSPMTTEQVVKESGHDLIIGALPYIEENLPRPYIDRLAKYLDSYLNKVFAQLPTPKVNTQYNLPKLGEDILF